MTCKNNNTNIKFGTDGFRAITGEDFNFENVEKITNSIIFLLSKAKKSAAEKPVIIGYDPRHKTKEFAYFSAEILKKAGFKVQISNCVVPTPVLAFASLKSLGAVMFTASHNPPEYSGMKFIPNNAAPASKEITDKIVENLDYKPISKEGGSISEVDFKEDYFEHLEKIIDFKKIKEAEIDFIYDGLYSSSVGYFDELLKRNGIKFESENCYHDPDFGGGLPEPKEKFMKVAKRGKICLANDGDADRFGVIDEKGNWISPNYVIAVLFEHLIKKGMKGKLVKTVATSQLLEDIAQKFNVETVTTPVGFKWLGAEMLKEKVIIAGEESGGLSIGSHIPEKDGILANLLILEAMAYENKSLCELVENVKKYGKAIYINERTDIRTKKSLEVKALEGFKIKEILTLDGTKLFLDDDKTWILIRKSGTEPLLRIYFESDSRQKIEKLKGLFDRLLA